MPLKPIDAKPRLIPRPIHAPYLQGDDRGGHVACQNITITNCQTGETLECHQAIPATRDPYDLVNVKGKYLERVEKEREQVKTMNSNSPNT